MCNAPVGLGANRTLTLLSAIITRCVCANIFVQNYNIFSILPAFLPLFMVKTNINPQSVVRTPITLIRPLVGSPPIFRTAAVILLPAFSRCSPLHLRQRREAICLAAARNQSQVQLPTRVKPPARAAPGLPGGKWGRAKGGGRCVGFLYRRGGDAQRLVPQMIVRAPVFGCEMGRLGCRNGPFGSATQAVLGCHAAPRARAAPLCK